MKQNKMEFSKKIYIFNLILVVFVVITSFGVVMFSGRLNITDLSPITVICTSAFVELGTFSVVYANKAKAENIIKIGKQIQTENIDKESISLANQITNYNHDFT